MSRAGWNRGFDLNASERAVVWGALWRLATIRWLLRSHGYRGLRSRFEAMAGETKKRGDLEPRRVGQLVDGVAKRVPWRATCLHRSLALAWLLRSRAVPAQVRIGVHRESDAHRFHAWVEVGDTVVNDAADVGARYKPFEDAAPPSDATFR